MIYGPPTDAAWKELLSKLLNAPDYLPSPRGRETRELLGHTYKVPMPAFLSVASRKVKLPFMFAEAAWIAGGSNLLGEMTRWMKTYAEFSDDGVFLRGAYGPKVVDQLGYVVDSLHGDCDSRQAYMNIWRERPGPSKDIACTTGMQFFQRMGRIHANVTMRSQDVVQGFTYDVFTFSAIANCVRLLLEERRHREGQWDVRLGLGDLRVTPGSLHLYRDPFGRGADQFEDAWKWVEEGLVDDSEYDGAVQKHVDHAFAADNYEQFVSRLKLEAEIARGGAELARG